MNNILLKSYLRCKRKAWLDFQGDKSLKSCSPHTSIKLINETSNFSKFTKGNLSSGLKSCERGIQGIVGLRIKTNLNEKYQVEVYPPLIVKTSGKSKWGEYKYIPAVSKLGRKITKEHLFDLALCSISLESIQESATNHGLVISNFQNNFKTEEIRLSKNLKKKALNKLYELIDSLRYSMPSITKDRKKCSICSWQKFCDGEAKLNGSLTDIDGIGSRTEELLERVGVFNVKQLASTEKSELSKKLLMLLMLLKILQ